MGANDSSSLIHRLIEGYEKAKKPIAYLIMVLAVALGTLPSEFLPSSISSITYSTVLLLLALILMEMLFEIYEKVVKEKKQINQINSTSLYNEISKIVNNEKTVNIKLIGVAGRFGWQNVIEKLLNENDPDSLINNKTRFNISIALIEPKNCEKYDYYERFEVVSTTVKTINKTALTLPEIAEPGSSLDLYLYDHMPNMLGFLINDNYLFLTQTYWEYVRNELVLRAGGSDYFVYNKSDDFGGQELITRFSGWFDFIQQNCPKNRDREAQ